MKIVAVIIVGAVFAITVLFARFFITNWAPDRPVSELAARWAPSPSVFIDVAGMHVHMRDEGVRDDPSPIVLLHGTAASLHTWEGWVDALKTRRRVIRFDLPGFGLTGPSPDGNYGIENYVRFVTAMLDKLIAGAPNAGMIVGTLPTDFRSVPLTSTLPTVAIGPNLQPIIVNGNPIPLFTILADGTPGPLPAGSIVPLSAITDLQQGYGLPPQLKAVPPFSALPHTGEPLPDKDFITPAEQAIFVQRINDYNTAITTLAAARNIPVADISGLFNSFVTPLSFGGVTLSKTFISGGLFSDDGTHLSDIGYALFANQYIKAINSAYATTIPVASLTQFFTNNGQNFGFGAANVTISEEAARNIGILWATPPPAPHRLRRVGH